MPIADFTPQDPDFTPEQVNECSRIIDGLRRIHTKSVRLGGTLTELREAADQVEALEAALDTVTRTRALETYTFAFDPDAPNGVLPFNPATGAFNPIAPPLEMTVEGHTVVANLAFGNSYESAPDTVQGGMVSALYDQLLAYAVMARGATGPTLWIRVAFLKPTPINEPLRFEARVEAVEGKKYTVKGSGFCGAERVSEAEALVLGSYEIPTAAGEPS